MAFLELPRTTLYYDLFAQNITPARQRVVLLLHGFAGTGESDFAGQIPLLQSQYTVLAPHLHGHGHSSHRATYTTAYYREDVADIVGLLDALALLEVRVLGFSDGAITALLLAALHPGRVTALAIHGAQATINARDTAAIRHWLRRRWPAGFGMRGSRKAMCGCWARTRARETWWRGCTARRMAS